MAPKVKSKRRAEGARKAYARARANGYQKGAHRDVDQVRAPRKYKKKVLLEQELILNKYVV